MEESLFKKIADELGQLKFTGTVFLHNYNEPLLDKRLPEFVSYLRRACPGVDIRFNSNGDFLTLEVLKLLIEAGINRVFITCYDGVVPQHIQDIQMQLPVKESDFLHVRTKNPTDLTIWDNRAGTINKLSNESRYMMPCHNPSVQMVIDYSGEVPVCCDDYFNRISLGNVNDCTLMELWDSPKAKGIRKTLRQGKRCKYVICKNCDSNGSFF